MGAVKAIIPVAGLSAVLVWLMKGDMEDWNRLAHLMADYLGVDPHSVNSLSAKCQIVLLNGLNKEICNDFRGIRRWVLCRAWQLIFEKKMRFRDALKQAWNEAKLKCAELGVEV